MVVSHAHTPLRARAAGAAGISLLEVLTVIAVVGIAMQMSFPVLSGVSASIERMNVRGYVLQDLRRAQAETVTHGCRGVFSLSTAGSSYSFGCDYLDYDPAGTPSPDVVIFRRTLPKGFSLTTDGPIIFNSRGQIVAVDGMIDERELELIDASTGAATTFENGRILGTGLFEYMRPAADV